MPSAPHRTDGPFAGVALADGVGLAKLSAWLVLLACLPAILRWPAMPPEPVIASASLPRPIQPVPSIAPLTATSDVDPLADAAAGPLVDPQHVYAIDADRARAVNDAIPFAVRPNPAASPFHFTGGPGDLARATDCLASAQIYEAGDDVIGEQAVAQVVLNRVRHPAFPDTICGVIFQGQERRTGCQFTFTCDGALARMPSPAAWGRARVIARAAIGGAVFGRVGLSTHYHTDWVVPYWSAKLDKTARVGTHLFFRWSGRWGAPPAFHADVSGNEPSIGRIARLSLAHRDAASPVAVDSRMAQARTSDMDGQTDAMPLASKSWTPSPVTPLPGGVRRDERVETAQDETLTGRPATVIALGPLPR